MRLLSRVSEAVTVIEPSVALAMVRVVLSPEGVIEPLVLLHAEVKLEKLWKGWLLMVRASIDRGCVPGLSNHFDADLIIRISGTAHRTSVLVSMVTGSGSRRLASFIKVRD